jgi:hypothetical protein
MQKPENVLFLTSLKVTIVQVELIKVVYSMKADSKIFKGIEYVQVSELPQTQRQILIQTINPELFIKLLVDGKIISGCLQYKDYSKWYDEQYQTVINSTLEEAVVPEMEIKPNLALNKL